MKTLKDIDEYKEGYSAPTYPDGTLMYNLVDKDELRTTVIKWIKYMQSENYNYEETCDIFGAIDWIKHFFNITEEELK